MIELVERIELQTEAEDTLTLPYALRQRSRQRVRLDSGREAALFLPPSASLRDGEGLLGSEGLRVRVAAAPEPVTTARTDDPVLLARACYHLGNRHVGLQVGEGWLRYQPDHVLDEMVARLGLTVERDEAAFEPERGAYHGAAAHAHAHGDDDDESRPHSHSHGHAPTPPVERSGQPSREPA